MRPKLSAQKSPGEQIVEDIRRATRNHYSADDKIRIVEQPHLSKRRTLAQIGVPHAACHLLPLV